jgi:phosphatidyl-myo-inositol dimannoside synthase
MRMDGSMEITEYQNIRVSGPVCNPVIPFFRYSVTLLCMRMIFLTRTWHGTGGMQRLSRDLARCMEEEYGKDAIVVHPSARGALPLLAFAVRAFLLGVRGGAGAQVHLGDVSLILPGVIIKRLTGARLSVTACGLDVLYPKGWYQRMVRMCLPMADRVCAVSDATADAVRERGVSADRIIVIPCGIWTDDRDAVRIAREHGPMLITVGRLIPRKGIAWFIDQVLPLLLSDFPGLQYHIVGDGPEAARIREATARQHVAEHVCMHSPCDDAARDALLLQSDVFVMPNVSIEGDMEGFGIVCIEAAKFGVSIAASRIQGISDAVRDGETGRFFEAGNAADCARVIGGLLLHPLQPADIRAAAEEQYGWPRLFARYIHDVFV